ncbi:cell death abnormality protein 8-like [Penaeus japonicus]|uniref:cell death abnormality protein 8-like n=1 Tax=Penaeus japonicus TaxID=27405 RepID=UPI001C716FDF|nr:cell death abnormality protein 8-like [Penaeus japonicus]
MSNGGRWAMPGRKPREEASDASSFGAYDNANFALAAIEADGDDRGDGGGRRGRDRRGEREAYSTSPSRRSSSSTKPPSGSRMGSISSDNTSPTLPMTPNTERRLRERSLLEVRQQLTDATNVAGRALAAGAKKGLQTLIQPMEPTEFGWFDALTALFSVGMFYFDVVSDSLLAYSMYSDPSTKDWFLSTALLLVIPLVVVNGFSVYWYWFDEKVCEPEGMCYKTPRVSPGVWAFRIISHILLQANILRYLDLLYYGYKSRRKGQVCSEARAMPEQHPDKFSLPVDRFKHKHGAACGHATDSPNYQKLWIHAERDAANVDLLASLLQDAPQLILQLYIMAQTVPAQALQGEISQTLMFQILSVAASLVAMSWSVSSFSRSTRLSEPTMGNLSPAGLLVLTLAHFCSIAPQVMCFALFSTKYMIIFVVVISCHWLAASFFVIVQVVCCSNPVRLGATFTHDVRKGPCNRVDDVAFSASFGLVLLYTFIDVGGAAPKIQGTVYHFLRVIEEGCMIAFWYLATDQDMWYHWVPLGMVPGFFVLGVLFVSIYYFCTHPDRRNRHLTV